MTQPSLAITDQKTGERLYPRIDGSGVNYGVTSVLGSTIPKQRYLVPWAAKVVAENAAYVMEELVAYACGQYEFGMDEPDSEILAPYFDDMDYNQFFDFDLLATDLKKTWELERDSAGTLGNEVHDMCDQIAVLSKGNGEIARALYDEWYENAVASKEALDRVLGFVVFCEENDVVVVDNEFTVYNDTLGYAGTCDLAAFVNGVPYYIDFKTNKTLSPEIALQICAYSRGEYIVHGDEKIKKAMPFFGDSRWDADKFDYDCNPLGAILHLQKKKTKFVEVDISDEVYDCFGALMLVKRLWVGQAEREVLGGTLWCR